jgi:hypothetical protein
VQLKQIHWVYISAVAFLIAAALCVYFIFFGSNIISSDKAILYYLILIPVGFSAAAFLSMAMRSYAKFRGTYLKYNLELSGPIVIFALVIAGGYFVYRNPPNPPIYDLTVYFNSVDRQIDKINGRLSYRNKSLQGQTDIKSGESVIKRVEKGTPLELIPDVPGFVLKENQDLTVPEYGKELRVALIVDTAFNTKKTDFVNGFSTHISSYTKNAFDFYDCLNYNINLILNYQPGPYEECFNAINRYSDAYNSLNADLNNYTRTFESQFRIDPLLMRNFVDDVNSIHSGLFLDYNKQIRDRLGRYLFDDKHYMDKKLADTIRKIIDEKVVELESKMKDLELRSKSIQDALPK